MPATPINQNDVQPGDVIRGRRMGNRTVGNYVVDRMPYRDGTADAADITDTIAVYAHREYNGGGNSRFMMIDAATARIIRSYR